MKSKSAPSEIRLSPVYFRLLMRRFGRTPELRISILDGTGISENSIEEEGLFLTLDQQLRQQDNLRRLFGDGWAVQAADLWGFPIYGLLGVASQSATDLRHALMTIIEQFGPYGRLWEFSLEEVGDRARFFYDLCVDMREDQWRSSLEIAFVGMQALIHYYLAHPLVEMNFAFSCARPGHALEIANVLRGPVTFDAPRNAITFPADWLARKPPLRDPAVYRLARAHLEVENATLSQSGPLAARVGGLLRAKPDGRAAAPEIASALGLSARTFARRLAAEGTSFRELLEVERRRRAAALTGGRTLKAAEAAEQLGYSDPASFARARRRWAQRVPGRVE